MFYLQKRAVAFEMLCVYSMVYALLRGWKKFLYLLVLCYKILYANLQFFKEHILR